MKAAVIVDSTAYLSEALAQHPDVYQVALSVNFSDGSVMKDTSDLQLLNEFYTRLKSESQLPTTSQPQPGDYLALLDQLVAAGYDTVYAIHLSSEISGTYQTARMLLSEYEDKLQAYAVDSGSSCMVMELLVKETLDWLGQGLSAEQVGRRLEWSARHSDVYLMVGDLNNLVKGGRLSASSAILGNILQIRPLLHFEEGKIAVSEKIRTTKKVYRRMVELVSEWQTRYPQGVHVGIGQAGAPEDLKVLDEMMKEAYPGMPLSYTNIGPVIGTHTGDGTKGLGIVPKLPADF